MFQHGFVLNMGKCEAGRVARHGRMHDTPQMDASFIQQNQIIERYLMGRLPLKGAQDFERYCRENPEAVTQLGLPDRINAALRLLDASGQPEPWSRKAATALAAAAKWSLASPRWQASRCWWL